MPTFYVIGIVLYLALVIGAIVMRRPHKGDALKNHNELVVEIIFYGLSVAFVWVCSIALFGGIVLAIVVGIKSLF